MNTLKLFNAVLARPSSEKPFISEDGFIIEPSALWAKDRIIDFYRREHLSGNDLNKSFHKSWAKIKNSTRLELLLHQIAHYLSTYGSDFRDEIYIPDEVLNVPDVKLVFKVIKGYTADELRAKCLTMLKSGIALKEETINELLSLLVDELGYVFTGTEGIKNKEAIIKIADLYGVVPANTMEFFRYIIYRATGKSLLIKNPAMVVAIKDSNYNPAVQFNQFGVEKLATIFNRFKPLFLAFKAKCPKTINKISKLSKSNHVPLVSNPLGRATSVPLTALDIHWLDNATPYALFKVISACYARISGQEDFLYRIRNGKSWAVEGNAATKSVVQHNLDFVLEYMRGRFNMSGVKVFLPDNVKFALPTSEKMFVGNFPTGTRFYGQRLAAGIYWENAWGARDIDLSAINMKGTKIGWNSHYNYGGGLLMYSGDITSAPHGAVEYMYANKGLDESALIQSNVYYGQDTCGYKIIIGEGDRVSNEYMMNPNNLMAEIKCESIQKQTVIGMLTPKKDKQCFVVLNFGAGQTRVSGGGRNTLTALSALYQQWKRPYSFNRLVKQLGAEVVLDRKDADFDFSLDVLEKDSFIKIFAGK